MKYHIAPEMFQNENGTIIMRVEEDGVIRYFRTDVDNEWLNQYSIWLLEGNQPEIWEG